MYPSSHTLLISLMIIEYQIPTIIYFLDINYIVIEFILMTLTGLAIKDVELFNTCLSKVLHTHFYKVPH